MTERLLQYIWQMQYFNRGELQTTKGEDLEIISPGTPNKNQGPDFPDARIRIGNTTWAGSVELHLNTSGWDDHGHSEDRNFRNVILHVVWENDLSDHHIPVLELKDRVSGLLITKYQELMEAPRFIPCENMIAQTDPLIKAHWMDRLLAERIERKADLVMNLLDQGRQNWQEIYWWMLTRNFGHSVNADAFESLARSLPVKLVSKHAGQIHQLESLLLGQAGLLERRFEEPYPIMLQKEYRFLQAKYGLKRILNPVHFLRMRPANFPTIRLAQLAMLIHTNGHMLELAKGTADLLNIRNIFDVSANDYWLTHYLPDKISEKKEKKIGDAMFANILINTIVPFLFAYGRFHRNENLKQRAFQWLSETEAEQHTICSGFRQCGLTIRNAADSQSLVELKTQYCDQRKCLDCSIGNTLLQERS